VWFSSTQNDFSPGAAIFSLHSLASPSDKCELRWKLTGGGGSLRCSFYLYRFRKYVSCGFPIINFCNPGVHYEMPCRSKRLIRGTRRRWRNTVKNNLTHDAFSLRSVIYTAMELWLYKWRRISWVTEMAVTLLFVLRHSVDCDSLSFSMQPNQKL